jgi:tRNA A58 N-methylase Trm61
VVDVGIDGRVIKMDLKDVEWDGLDSVSKSVIAGSVVEVYHPHVTQYCALYENNWREELKNKK